jgi:hypothetical protein
MDTDDIRRTWQAQAGQARLVIDAERLLAEVRRNRRALAATVFWRDVREVGVSVLMLPVWIFLGVSLNLPWTWYLGVPALLWVAGFMLVDRWRHSPRPAAAGETLTACVESSLGQVEHQIWLLRNVFWWYLLPLAVPIVAFFGQVSWNEPVDGWVAAVHFTVASALVAVIFAGVYWINQVAVRANLAPRRRELQELLASLRDVPADPGAPAP